MTAQQPSTQLVSRAVSSAGATQSDGWGSTGFVRPEGCGRTAGIASSGAWTCVFVHVFVCVNV
jgi:hypothetical protein